MCPNRTLLSASILTALLGASVSFAQDSTTLTPDAKRIEVAFVLDTTGSMGGLIEGAKQKVWQIANEVARGEPTPELKLALVGYRDRGDEYITRRTALTTDLDAIYGELTAFQANGGGDGPESVNQALHEAVHSLAWTPGDDVLKIIFLVGDAPPHMDYEQDIPYTETCSAAVKAGLIINTIQCGTDTSTREAWQAIARLAEGEYIAIDRSGGMAAIVTPMDAELADLSRQLVATAIPYGDEQRQRDVTRKLEVAGSAPAAASVDRMAYIARSAKSSDGRVVMGGGDLVEEVQNGRIEYEQAAQTPAERLPESMREMSEADRVTYLREQVAKRVELQRRVTELSRQREMFLRDELAKRGGDGFDRRVAEIVREQALRGDGSAKPRTSD